LKTRPNIYNLNSEKNKNKQIKTYTSIEQLKKKFGAKLLLPSLIFFFFCPLITS
jgi:hypothetical protein